MYNVKEDEDGYENSFSERKTHTNIPTLKNNKLNQQPTVIPYSERILNGTLKIDSQDIHGVANQMIFEINLVAGRMLILQH